MEKKTKTHRRNKFETIENINEENIIKCFDEEVARGGRILDTVPIIHSNAEIIAKDILS